MIDVSIGDGVISKLFKRAFSALIWSNRAIFLHIIGSWSLNCAGVLDHEIYF